VNECTRCGGTFDIESRETILADLENRASRPDFWASQDKAKAVIAEAGELRAVVNPFKALEKASADIDLLLELAGDEADQSHREQVFGEVSAEVIRAEAMLDKLELQSLLSGELDGNNAYVSLHAGAGGTESCDWADMLFRMYRRYCESSGFEVEMLDRQAGDEAGIKSVSFAVNGPYAYGHMAAERGVHRLVRISPFDSNKRRHTSFAAVDVVAAVSDDIEVELNDDDLRVDTFRSSGAGGQHVNTTDSAVRITHMPTGIVVSCQAERSQHKNRAIAMKVLKARLYDWTIDRQRKDMERFYGEKGEIAWGSQIRSYVLQPYTMAKDHRTKVETSNVASVLDGDLSKFIQAFLRKQAADGSAAPAETNNREQE
jgi:peptide chain release factor 2